MALIRTNGSAVTASIIKIGNFSASDTPPTLNVSALVPDYQTADVSDFFIANPTATATAVGNGGASATPSLAYNANTGVITVNNTIARDSGAGAKCNGTVFYTKGGLPT